MADDDDKAGMIPKARLDAEIAKRKDAELRAGSLQEQLTEAKALAASSAKEAGQLKAQADGIPELQTQIQTLRADLDRTRTEGAAHTAMLESGVSDGSVRDYAMHLYSKARTEAGDKAPDFATWWGEQASAPNAVLKPFLAPEQSSPDGGGATETPTTPPAAATPPPPSAPGPDAGAKQAPSTPAPYSPGRVASMSRDEFKAQRETLLKGLSVANLG